jgi:hypothetical protein
MKQQEKIGKQIKMEKLCKHIKHWMNSILKFHLNFKVYLTNEAPLLHCVYVIPTNNISTQKRK